MTKKVLAVGDGNIDVVFAGLSIIPRPEQETLAQDMQIPVGGQTATFVCALSALRVPVVFLGRVGDDEHG